MNQMQQNLQLLATPDDHPTMHAVVQTGYGEPHDVLEQRIVDQPVVGPDDVLVRVVATSVNTPDWAAVTGRPAILRLVFGLRRPVAPIRGTDVAGVVVAVGDCVAGFETGDEVFGSTSVPKVRKQAGTFSELTVVPAAQLAPKPRSLGFEEAAASVMSGLTALALLRDTGAVGAGTRVLVNGASGGVGTFAIQIAKAFGAHVTGVASGANVELVRALGADEVVDYTRESFLNRDDRYDVILDNVMNHPPRHAARALADGGILIPNSIGSGSRLLGGLPRIARAKLLGLGRIDVRTANPATTRRDLAELTELIESGAVAPVIDSRFELADAADAIARMLSRRARGNIVVAVPAGHNLEPGAQGSGAG